MKNAWREAFMLIRNDVKKSWWEREGRKGQQTDRWAFSLLPLSPLQNIYIKAEYHALWMENKFEFL